MLLHYWEKRSLTPGNWRSELALMGITAQEVIEAVEKVIAKAGEAAISSYHFQAPLGDPGSIAVCHNLGRGALTFGMNTRWGRWDEAYEILTLDESGEKYSFEGNPVSEGDDGSCSLGNF